MSSTYPVSVTSVRQDYYHRFPDEVAESELLGTVPTRAMRPRLTAQGLPLLDPRATPERVEVLPPVFPGVLQSALIDLK